MPPLPRNTPLMFLQFLFLTSLFHGCFGGRGLKGLVREQPLLLPYHGGLLLNGNVTVNLLWYGAAFKPSQKSIITDFISSLSLPPSSSPSVSAWWNTARKYYPLASNKRASLALSVGDQTSDDNCSLGKSLTRDQISQLASRAQKQKSNALTVVLTSPDIAVQGFCSDDCGTHGSARSSLGTNKVSKFTYIWVGNSEAQCPGQCAWPFHQPIYGPQTPALVSPNGDVGVDGMVINLATLLAATVTNPFGDGFYQGEATAPLEASSACPGIFGSGAYPGYPGKLLVDPATGGSYNSHGVGSRKYLLPAMYDPATSSCFTQL